MIDTANKNSKSADGFRIAVKFCDIGSFSFSSDWKSRPMAAGPIMSKVKRLVKLRFG